LLQAVSDRAHHRGDTVIKYRVEKNTEGVLRLSLQGEIEEADLNAAHLLGFTTVAQLRHATGPFLRHANFMLSQEMVELVTRVQETGRAVGTMLTVTNPAIYGLRRLSIRIKSLHDADNCLRSYLVSISDILTDTSTSAVPDATAVDSRNAFFTSVGHDIRTPLNSLSGVLRLLGNTQLNPQQARYLQIAEASAKTLLHVTDELLDLTKLDAGEYVSKSDPFSLHEMIQECMQEFAPRAINKQLTFSVSINSSVPDVMRGDTRAIRYILKTVVENAVKYTDTGSVSMLVTCIATTDSVAQIGIRLRDTGCGIADEQKFNLQTLFSDPDSTVTPKDGCARFGLTLCQRYLCLLHGTLNIESEVGQGTEFSVTLPVTMDHSAESGSDRQLAAITGRRTIAVDENHINLEYICGVLEPLDISVDCFSSGKTALAAIQRADQGKNPYDLVLLDFCLPDGNGLALSQQIVESDLTRHPRLIMLSTFDQGISNAELNARGISASLTKPVRSADLVGTLAQVFGSEPRSAWRTEVRIFCNQDGADSNPPIEPGENVTVSYCTIPPAALLRDQALARDESTPSEETEKADLDAPLILVVEDNAVNLLVAEQTLQDAGYRVDVAENGEEALTRLDQGGVDLVLMDCQMPVLDGFAATRRIRTLERDKGVLITHQLPVVALTANATKGDREKCLAAGMNDYIAKPFQPRALFAVLNQYIRTPSGIVDDESGDWPIAGTG